MSDEEFALLQAVREVPAADTPRLVYADYLEERGDAASVARAEFIRVQCELARGGDDSRMAVLAEREAALRGEFEEWWDAEIREGIRGRYPTIAFEVYHDRRPAGEGVSWRYRRGMISSVSLPSAFLGAYPDLDQHLGPVEHLRIQLPDGQSLPAVPSFPGWKFRGLKILDVHGPTYTFDGLLMSLTVLALQTQGGVTSVPILRLTTSVNDVNNRVPHIAGYIINGQMNPVVITNCVFDRPTIPIVRDPLNLWPLVRPWAETYIRANWNESVEPISPDQRQRTPSARLPHLVRYYQLAGLPAPTEHAEPILPVPPKRSVASKVRRWWRRRF